MSEECGELLRNIKYIIIYIYKLIRIISNINEYGSL